MLYSTIVLDSLLHQGSNCTENDHALHRPKVLHSHNVLIELACCIEQGAYIASPCLSGPASYTGLHVVVYAGRAGQLNAQGIVWYTRQRQPTWNFIVR